MAANSGHPRRSNVLLPAADRAATDESCGGSEGDNGAENACLHGSSFCEDCPMQSDGTTLDPRACEATKAQIRRAAIPP
jgi:hypothetical protein